MANYFDSNIKAFDEAATYIKRHCTYFAGRNITAPHCPWPFTVLAKNFSHCDESAVSINFDCICQTEGIVIHCIAEVDKEAHVKFIPVH